MPLPPPQHMKAIEITKPGGPEVLKIHAPETPRPGPGEILIAVEAAGVNGPDVYQRLGLYPPPPGAPETPGLEVAGRVAALGEGVTRWREGDRVAALVAGGGYAEYCLADARHALTVPDGISMEETAGLPETVFTVWTNVFERGALKQGESFLVHGGTSGIGTTAIQIAAAKGARVFATAGSDQKVAKCIELGAEKAVNYKKDDYVAVLKEATGGKGIDVILDMVGGDYIERDIDLAAEDGRIVQIAFRNGSIAEVNFMPLMLKRLTLTGSTLRARPAEEKARLAQAVEEHVWPLLAEGKVRTVIDSTFALEDVAKAHERIDSGAHIGKIILTV